MDLQIIEEIEQYLQTHFFDIAVLQEDMKFSSPHRLRAAKTAGIRAVQMMLLFCCSLSVV